MARRRAILLVRNPFLHDARVLRAAHVLSDRGFDPLVVAVLSTEVRERMETVEGVPVLRLDPSSPLSWLRRRLARAAPGGAAERWSAPDPPPSLRPAIRLHRWMRTVDFYRRALAVVRRERPALLHCNDYNTMWVGVLARWLFGTRVVYDAHEIWPDRNGRREPRAWLLACEALFVRAADAVVSSSPGFSDVMAARYRIPRPAVVRNVPAAGSEPLSEHGIRCDVAVYAGGLLPHRGIETMIDALALTPGLQLLLIGPGSADYVAALRAQAERRGVAERVAVEPPVPPGELVERLNGLGFGVALFEPMCLSHRMVAPNKLFEYVVAGLPVLVSDLPVMRAYVEEHGVGLTAPPADVARVAHAARELMRPEVNAALRKAVAAAARVTTWERERLVLERAYEDATAA